MSDEHKTNFEHSEDNQIPSQIGVDHGSESTVSPHIDGTDLAKLFRPNLKGHIEKFFGNIKPNIPYKSENKP